MDVPPGMIDEYSRGWFVRVLPGLSRGYPRDCLMDVPRE